MSRFWVFVLTPILSNSQPQCGICPKPDVVGQFANSTLGLVTNPVGNAFDTWTTLDVRGRTSVESGREFLVNLGLDVETGATAPGTPYKDKVTLYTGVVGHPGCGDIWSINPLVTQSAGSGSYNAQGIELDFNNMNADRGGADAGGGLAPPVSYGMSVTGAGEFKSTSGYLLSGPGTHRIWNRGIVFANDCVEQSTFQDLGNPDKSIDIRGSPKYGIYQASKATKNFFAGGTTVAGDEEREPASALDVDGDVSVTGNFLLYKSARPGINNKQSRAHVLSGHNSRSRTIVATGTCQVLAAGGCKVELKEDYYFPLNPGSFEAFYQLTAIGAPMPQLHIAKELNLETAGQVGQFFEIGGGVPGGKVHYLLTLLGKVHE